VGVVAMKTGIARKMLSVLNHESLNFTPSSMAMGTVRIKKIANSNMIVVTL
jgi:hypothetical protein